MVSGYNGKLLRVNLTDRKISVDNPDEDFCRKYIGGAGFSTYFMMKEIKPGIDPFSPENKMFFMAGPCTGYPFSGSGRHSIGCKSPETFGYAKSESGGFWGAELRHAGFDGIIVEGRADKPVYLWVHDGEAEIKDASHLWGKTTKETQETIRNEIGDQRIRMVMIGPGGENMVRFACVINDLKEAAGRGGTGAIMGSKNLKAIATRGKGGPQAAKPEYFGELRNFLQDNQPLWQSFKDYGTGAPAMMASMIPVGNMPIRNFRDGDFPVAKIDGGTLKSTIGIGMDGCYACVLRCKKVVKVDEPNLQVDPEYGGPEYETLASMGSTCGVEDLRYISKANELCGAYSLDTIACGVTVAFAMELYENGIITRGDTGGIDLRFGDGEAMVQVIDMIARRKGIGNILAEGTKLAAEKIGLNAEQFAMNVKGVEVPMHDPRAKFALGVGYAINPHGADHCMNMHDTAFSAVNPALLRFRPLGFWEPVPTYEITPKKMELFRYTQGLSCLCDHLVVCQFPPYNLNQYEGMLRAATGWDTSLVEMFKVTQRTLTLARMYNLREGHSAADDKLPKRFFQQHVGGPSANTPPYKEEEVKKGIRYYYRIMGWDEDGVPTPETLDILDISWAANPA
ncbi:MAG: aldehyde ferredoxin oxidoreductase family protein [Dehalococcoidales bacterium]|nr:aldehyde ferredoxin oxidoreductase family protein [Dehalococcoidales bacterium]